jgi:hypothetical protein
MNPFMSSPFRQHGAGNAISASTTSASAALARAADQSIVVTNPHATSVAFVAFGAGSAPTALNTHVAVPPQSSLILSVTADITHVAVLLDAATATVYVACGDGNII